MMVPKEVLDCPYWQEVLFPILLTANEYAEKALKVYHDP